jgi:hypothetical protein
MSFFDEDEFFNIFMCKSVGLDRNGFIKTDLDFESIQQIQKEYKIRNIKTLVKEIQNEGFIAKEIDIKTIKLW